MTILKGYKYGDKKEYVIPLHVTIPEINLSKNMTFLVDTGTITTTICGPEATSLDLSSLSDRQFGNTVDFLGNIMRVTFLHNCRLAYISDEKYSVTLEEIDVVTPGEQPINPYTFMHSLNLLGMDFLESFKISFRNDLVYLEK